MTVFSKAINNTEQTEIMYFAHPDAWPIPEIQIAQGTNQSLRSIFAILMSLLILTDCAVIRYSIL